MRFCLEASNQWSPKNIFQSRTHRAKAHIKSTSAAKAILGEKERGSGPFLALFKAQISPQLRRNYCLFQTLGSADREVRSPRRTQTNTSPSAAQNQPSATLLCVNFTSDGQLTVSDDLAEIVCGASFIHGRYGTNRKSILGRMLCRHLDLFLPILAAGQMSQ